MYFLASIFPFFWNFLLLWKSLKAQLILRWISTSESPVAVGVFAFRSLWKRAKIDFEHSAPHSFYLTPSAELASWTAAPLPMLHEHTKNGHNSSTNCKSSSEEDNWSCGALLSPLDVRQWYYEETLRCHDKNEDKLPIIPQPRPPMCTTPSPQHHSPRAESLIN